MGYYPNISRFFHGALLTAGLVSCGSGFNSIEVKTAKETSAEHCEERGKCVKDPKGLVLYNPELVTDKLVVKQDTPSTLLSRFVNLVDEPKLLVVAEKVEPLIRGVALVSELEPCDSPRGIDGTNPTAGALRKLKEGRYKTCLVYMGEGYLKRVMSLDPINIDTTSPDVAGGVSVSGVTPNSGFISWSKAGDNLSLDGDLLYTVYLSTDELLNSLDAVKKYGNPLPGKILGSTSFGMTSLLEKTLYHAAVVVRDEAGNEALVGTTNFTTPQSDVTAPTVTITSNRDPGPTNLTSIFLTIKFSESVTGFDASDVQLIGGSKGEFTANDASTYTLAVTATGSSVSASIPANAAADTAGNKSTASATWSLAINGAAASTVATPAAGIYTSTTSVSLSTTTPGASIYYTLDDSTPTTSSSLYAGSITVAATQIIKTLVVAPNYNPSAVTSHAYTITGTVQAPTFSVSAGAYGQAQTVALNSATPGATIYYTTNGTDPTSASAQFSGAITVSTSQTIKAMAVLTNWANSSVASAAYTINGAVATPTFSVSAGSYGPAQTVTLSTTTAGATIYYTTNGTDPTTASTAYSSAITVSSTSTIKAFATKANFSDSAIASAAYTINGAVATPTFSVAAGSYGPSQTVTLSTATAGATIYYTTNGTDPTTASTVYSSAITVASTSTIKAFATKANFSDSAVASAAYTINGAVATPTASPDAGIYTTAQSVTLSSATAGATIYYTLDGSTPTTSSTPYSTPVFVGVSQTIKAIAVKSAFVDSNVGTFGYTITGTVQAPTFSAAAGAYGPAQTVTLSSATPGATIYYTTNGSNPTTSSTQYSAPINVSTSQTIKAFAVLTNWADSSVSTAPYTINGAIATPTFSVSAGAYGPAQTVTLSTTTAGATIYYTTNGTDPTTASTVYSTAITVSSTSTIKAFATKADFSNSAIASAAYTINGAVATPTFSVAAGSYGPAQTVTLSTTTAGATIYYTTNGTDPTTASTVYSSAITVSTTSTIKAYAIKSGYSDSAISSAAYTINGAVATPTFSVGAGTYTAGQSVTLSTATAGATIYYTTDGLTPTSSSAVYSTAISVAGTLTIKAIATKSNFVDSSVATAAYSINITPDKVSYTYTGANQTFTVPAGVTSISLKLWGGGGGAPVNSACAGVGGAGGFASGTLAVNPGEVLTLIVAGGGGQQSGGGRTAIRNSAGAELITAGGGGGAGECGLSGGAGGGLTGVTPALGAGNGAGGGTQTAGGAGGSHNVGSTCGYAGPPPVSASGTQFQGGAGYGSSCTDVGGFGGGGRMCDEWCDGGGGGGGGGYFGGGGGGGGYADGFPGGGGGSSYVGGVTSGVTIAGSGATPPLTSDSDYVVGVGTGGAAAASGGSGLVIIKYNGGDIYFDKVTLLMHMNGNDTSTTALDTATVPKSISANGNAKISTTKSKFGGASAYFDGSGDYFLGPAHSGYAFGTGDFTVEFYVNFDRTDIDMGLIDSATSLCCTGQLDWGIYYSSTTGLGFFKHWGGITPATASWSPTAGVWYHVAVQRHSGTIRMFIDGTEKTVSDAGGFSATNFQSTGLHVGVTGGPTYFKGYMDEVRITKGKVRYTSNFALSASEFPEYAPKAIPQTGLQVWLKADVGVLDSNNNPISTTSTAIATWQDQSGNSRHVTASGTTAPLWISGANGRNGLPLIRVDQIDDGMTHSSKVPFSNATIFAVHRSDGNPSRDTRLFTTSYQNGIGFGSRDIGRNLSLVREWITWLDSGNSDVYTTKIFMADMTLTGATVSTYSSNAWSVWHSTTSAGSADSNNPWYNQPGDYSEIIWYDRALSDEEKVSVASYLRARWSVP